MKTDKTPCWRTKRGFCPFRCSILGPVLGLMSALIGHCPQESKKCRFLQVFSCGGIRAEIPSMGSGFRALGRSGRSAVRSVQGRPITATISSRAFSSYSQSP